MTTFLLSLRTRSRRVVLRAIAIVAVAGSGAALAAAPCGEWLASYLAERSGEVRPCLLDLQESGFCFVLPGTTLETATRTLDAHLQAYGAPRPEWITSPSGQRTRLPGGNGNSVTLEVVIAHDGPFATRGACRIVPER